MTQTQSPSATADQLDRRGAFRLLCASLVCVGLVGSGSFPAAQAYIADRTTPAERTRHITGIHSAFMIGLVLGPALGGLLVGISILAPLYVVAVVAFASTIALALFLLERRPPQDRAVMPRLKVSDPRLVPFMIASMAMSTCHASTMQTIGFYMIDTLDLDPETAAFHIGISLTAMALATLFVQLVGIRLLDPTPRQLMRVGTGVALMAFPVLLTTQSEMQTLGGMVLLGAGLGMLRPSIGTAASLAVKPSEQVLPLDWSWGRDQPAM